MNREQIITSMCHTYKHTHGITNDWPNDEASYTSILASGMTLAERESLWKKMARIFDTNIAPNMEFKSKLTSKNICGND